MSQRDKLLKQALESPANMRYEDVCRLAEHFGFQRRKAGGTSHRVYKRSGYFRILNFQNDNGKAKDYQVKQLINALRDLGEID